MATSLAQITDSEFSREKIDLIKTMVAKDCTDDELQLFLYTCKKTGLDPLARQIYCIKRGGKMSIQTGIDGYRVIADRTSKLAGISDYVFESEEGKYPNKATVTVRKLIDGGTIADFTATARWGEYNAGGPMWAKMPFLMLGKCAEALALRKAFPADLSGVYTAEEMAQADNAAQGEAVFAEVERQKAAHPLLVVTAGAAPTAIPPELDWMYQKSSGVLICRILDAQVKSKKDKPDSTFVILQINGKIEGSAKDKAYYWHATNRDLLLGAKGKVAKMMVEAKGDFPIVTTLLEVDGVKVEQPAQDGMELQARLIATMLDWTEDRLMDTHKNWCDSNWSLTLAELQKIQSKAELGDAAEPIGGWQGAAQS